MIDHKNSLPGRQKIAKLPDVVAKQSSREHRARVPEVGERGTLLDSTIRAAK